MRSSLRNKFKIGIFLILAGLSIGAAFGQATINAQTGINYVPVTHAGVPTLTCPASKNTATAATVGTPYTDLTNSNQYVCMSIGWVQVNGGGGGGGATLPFSCLVFGTSGTAGRCAVASDLGAILKVVKSPSYATIELAVAACGGVFPCRIDVSSPLTQSTSPTYTVPGGVVIRGIAGGSITPGTGKTLELTNVNFYADTVAFFGTPGTIAGLRGPVPAEWFGATGPYGSITAAAGGADDSTKVAAAIAAITRGGWVEFRCGYYHVNNIAITTSAVGIKGTCHGYSYPANSQVSVIISSSTAGDKQIAFGNGAAGAQITWNVLEDIAFQRSVHSASGSIGLSLDNVGGMYLRNVKIEDSQLLGYFHMAPSFNFGAYALSGDWGLSLVAPSAYAADTPKGFWMDSADGNEMDSLNLVDSAVDCAALVGTGAVTTGYLISGTAISDVNVSNGATSGCNYASRTTYTGSTSGVASNVRFDNFVADTSQTNSVLVENVRSGAHGSGGSITFNGGVLNSFGSCNVDVENSLGVSFTGKIHIDSGTRSCVNNSSDVSFDSAQFNNIGFPDTKALVFTGTVNSKVNATFTNLSTSASSNVDVEFDSSSTNNVVVGSSFSLAATNAVKCDGTSGANVVGLNGYDPTITTPVTGCNIPYQVPVALTTTGTSGASTFNPSTGALNIPNYAVAGGVTAFSGDGNFANNSASTGGVTLTLVNALAHKFWGNGTGATAAPGYFLIGTNDLSPNLYVAGAGSVNVMTATLVPAATALTAGLQARVLPNLANTTTTPTLNLNALGAKTITKCGTAALVAGDYSTTAIADFVYDGTEWQLQNPLNACGASAGAVTSVAAADASVTVTPTTGAVTVALNVAHANIFTAPQFLTQASSAYGQGWCAQNSALSRAISIFVDSSANGNLESASTCGTAGSLRALIISGISISMVGDTTVTGKVTSTLGNAAITSATGGTGITSVTCATAACNVSRGSYTVVGGTATTGTIITLVWPTTTTAWVCSVDENGGTGFLGIGHGVATATGMTVSAGVTVVGQTFTVDYNCVP